MIAGAQLALDLPFAGDAHVGDRVRVRDGYESSLPWKRLAGCAGVVTRVWPRCPRTPGDATWLPVSVQFDSEPDGRTFSFEHEDLEVLP